MIDPRHPTIVETVETLEAKIEKATHDIKTLQSELGHDRQASALMEYREYLQDQLNELKNGNRS
jgi:FtsZ-binding cell division protein ZapB